MTDSLSRLRAGLDRDEAIARAAADRAAEWRSDGNGVAGGPFEPRPDWLEADEEWTVPESGTHTIVYNEGWPLEPEALHIGEFDPSRVLRQVQVFRELADEARLVLAKNDPGLTDAGTLAESVLELLASIYAEDTTETGEPKP